MELIDQQKMILRDYKKRLEQITSHRNIWKEKVDELDAEINQTKMIIEITEKSIQKAEAKNTA